MTHKQHCRRNNRMSSVGRRKQNAH